MSDSLERLEMGLAEVQALLAANPQPRSGHLRLNVLRAIGRSAVVLTTSHLEAYLHNLAEESVAFIVSQGTMGDQLPVRLRLRHTSRPLEEVVATGWENRENKLLALFASEAPLWVNGTIVEDTLDHARFLGGMKTPRSGPVVKYFKDWGIDDIFTAITRKTTTRAELYLRINELGEKRNLIAHGDFAVQATVLDVKRFLVAVTVFCQRVDRVMSKRLSDISGRVPW